MRVLSDDAVAHLREITELPDLDSTRYELVRELGRGGIGVVYEVHDRELARNVAMKVVESEWRAEARIIAALEHPGIVPVHDAGALPDGRLFYTMRLLRGTRLDEWAKAAHGLTERLRLFARICEPVAFAHARGVVHRDLKPENVMVGELGEVLVLDWGIVGVGTPGYMAPEQARGENADVRFDVYALGAVLAGWYARRVQSVPKGIVFGFVVGLVLAFAVAAMPDPSGRHYWWQIMVPGSILGGVIGWATQRYGRVASTRGSVAGVRA